MEMERRAEPRLPVDQSIKVTFLGPPGRQVDGVITDLSGLGMRVVLTQAAPLDAAIRIDLDDTLLLGEVCYCAPLDGGFAVGIRFCHSLAGLDQLAKRHSPPLHARAAVALT